MSDGVFKREGISMFYNEDGELYFCVNDLCASMGFGNSLLEDLWDKAEDLRKLLSPDYEQSKG